MPRLKRLSGAEVMRIFERFGFERFSQAGSHVKMRRLNADGQSETLVVPVRRELKAGMTHALFRQAAEYIPEADLRPYFFHR